MSEETNGTITAEAPIPIRGDSRGSTIANRTPWLTLPAPWDNLEIRAWLDYPKDVADLWTPKDGETKEARDFRVKEACKATFLAHRGKFNHEPWRDSEDEELPQPDTDEFWDLIPTPLGGAIVKALWDEMAGNRPSRASRKKKSRR